MRSLIDRYRRRHARLSRGQSLTEFALVLPVFLLIVLIGLDFGRAFLGYISLQQSARIAANFAGQNPTAWNNPGNASVRADYQTMVANDAAVIGCTLPVDGSGNTVVPDPAFASAGKEVGTLVEATIPCDFDLITPFISAILADPLPLSASSTFPVRVGFVAGGGGGSPGPVAAFTCTPTSGEAALVVDCTDASTNNPTTWEWDFDEDGAIDATTPDASFTFATAGLYSVSLRVANINGSDTHTRVDYIDVTLPPPAAPVANFSGTPTNGDAPLTVAFTDLSTNAPTSWEWDFDEDGVVDDTTQNPSFTYTQPGTYRVTLTATNAGGSDSISKNNYITVTSPNCIVPNVVGLLYDPANKPDAVDAAWQAAGFSQPVIGNPLSNTYVVGRQNPNNGLSRPCQTTVLTVRP